MGATSKQPIKKKKTTQIKMARTKTLIKIKKEEKKKKKTKKEKTNKSINNLDSKNTTQIEKDEEHVRKKSLTIKMKGLINVSDQSKYSSSFSSQFPSFVEENEISNQSSDISQKKQQQKKAKEHNTIKKIKQQKVQFNQDNKIANTQKKKVGIAKKPSKLLKKSIEFALRKIRNPQKRKTGKNFKYKSQCIHLLQEYILRMLFIYVKLTENQEQDQDGNSSASQSFDSSESQQSSSSNSKSISNASHSLNFITSQSNNLVVLQKTKSQLIIDASRSFAFIPTLEENSKRTHSRNSKESSDEEQKQEEEPQKKEKISTKGSKDKSLEQSSRISSIVNISIKNSSEHKDFMLDENSDFLSMDQSKILKDIDPLENAKVNIAIKPIKRQAKTEDPEIQRITQRTLDITKETPKNHTNKLYKHKVMPRFHSQTPQLNPLNNNSFNPKSTQTFTRKARHKKELILPKINPDVPETLTQQTAQIT